MPFGIVETPSSKLVKERLAARLRQEILKGSLAPGERIVEGTWARRFGVAQASVREAINILIAEGFVQKGHGRSARVVRLSEADVRQIYELRAALEGIAARLLVAQGADLAGLERLLGEMRLLVAGNDIPPIIDCIFRFHSEICALSRNRYIVEAFDRSVTPLFAFTLIRMTAKGIHAEPFVHNMQIHENIVAALRTGDPFVAGQYVATAVLQLGEVACDVWARGEAAQAAKPRRRGGPRGGPQ